MGLQYPHKWKRLSDQNVWVFRQSIWQAEIVIRVRQDIRSGLWGGKMYLNIKLDYLESVKENIPFVYETREGAQIHGERWAAPKMR